MKKKVKCWEFLECNEKKCSVYNSKELRCWLIAGTHCRNEIQGKFLEKIEMCLNCAPFKANIDVDSLKMTLTLVNEQFREFRRMVEERDRESETTSTELTLGLSEVFEALKAISSGDPEIRITETSKLKLVAKLKHMVNLTAENVGEMVDLSHEFAIGLAEHFDVLHRVSKGNLTARVSGSSQVELLESLKKVTNQMIESVSKEITERKKAEEEIRQARRELDHIFRIAGDGMCVIDWDFNVLRVNETFEHLFNAPHSEVIGRKCHEIWEDPRCHTPECTFARVLAGEERVESEMVKKRAGGTSVPCMVVSTPLKGADDEIRAIVSTYKDLSKLKMAQDQLLQSEKMAAIGQLAAGVAHEINNPVGFISSNLNTLDEYREDITALLQTYVQMEGLLANVEKGEQLENALHAAQELKEKMDIEFVLDDFGKTISESKEGTDRVKKIVADLKDFSHAEEHELTYADINKGLESTLNIVRNELKYKAKVTKDFGELPQIACYPQQLNQVFMNILVNAAQAIEKQGEIDISTRTLDGKVEIRISDTGKGIPNDVLPRIFDPFFTTKAVGEGTGLGLNMAYNIIKKHKGDIRVESTVGEGTTFIVDIPVG